MGGLGPGGGGLRGGKAPDFFFCMAKAHTWLSLLLVHKRHSAKVKSTQ